MVSLSLSLPLFLSFPHRRDGASGVCHHGRLGQQDVPRRRVADDQCRRQHGFDQAAQGLWTRTQVNGEHWEAKQTKFSQKQKNLQTTPKVACTQHDAHSVFCYASCCIHFRWVHLAVTWRVRVSKKCICTQKINRHTTEYYSNDTTEN